MSDSDRHTVTQLLHDWRGGKEQALEQLMPAVYQELRRLAQRYMRGERSDHTLQTTALVHEAFVRLVDAKVDYTDRIHFYAVAARSMRRILVDHARTNRRAKRGGGAQKIQLDEGLPLPGSPDLVDLDLALQKLAEQDDRKAKTIELHYFGGLTYDQIAELLEVSASTVRLDLRLSKAWLARELKRTGETDAPA